MIYNIDGSPKPNSPANQYEMLRDHPDTKGLFRTNDGAVMVVRQPPWHESGAWADRKLSQDDIFRATMWLENRGLTPKRGPVREIIYQIARENC